MLLRYAALAKRNLDSLEFVFKNLSLSTSKRYSLRSRTSLSYTMTREVALAMFRAVSVYVAHRFARFAFYAGYALFITYRCNDGCRKKVANVLKHNKKKQFTANSMFISLHLISEESHSKTHF